MSETLQEHLRKVSTLPDGLNLSVTLNKAADTIDDLTKQVTELEADNERHYNKNEDLLVKLEAANESRNYNIDALTKADRQIVDLTKQLSDLSGAVREMDNYGVFGHCFEDGKTGVIDVESDFYDLSRGHYEALVKAALPQEKQDG